MCYRDQVLYFFRNPLLSLSKPHKVTLRVLLMSVLLHPLQCILVCHHMVLLSSMDHLFLPMMVHFPGDQHIITTMVAAYLQAAPIDLCICLDRHLILVDPWLETVCFVYLALYDNLLFLVCWGYGYISTMLLCSDIVVTLLLLVPWYIFVAATVVANSSSFVVFL